jgi:chloramphenicol-sensitive protein RarD
MNKGILYGLGAYLIWGFIPIYFKLLKEVPALEILGNRILWSFVFLAGIITVLKEWKELIGMARKPRILVVYAVSSCLLTINWLVYIWGVNSGYIIETSLGYFINPLINVLLGVLFLHERLRPLQWVPIGLAALGVLYMTINYGQLPWIALTLAFSFGLYGLVKKIAPLGSLHSLTIETGILILPAVLYLLFAASRFSGATGGYDLPTHILLAGTGLVTAVPLLLFGAAARRIDLTLMGVLQYLAPTIQFLLGVLVYGEPFTTIRLVGFSFIWLALILFWVEGAIQQRKLKMASVASSP